MCNLDNQNSLVALVDIDSCDSPTLFIVLCDYPVSPRTRQSNLQARPFQFAGDSTDRRIIRDTSNFLGSFEWKRELGVGQSNTEKTLHWAIDNRAADLRWHGQCDSHTLLPTWLQCDRVPAEPYPR